MDVVLWGMHRTKEQGGLGLCLEILTLQVVGGRRIIVRILEEKVLVLSSRENGLPLEGTRHDQGEKFNPPVCSF